MNLKKIKIINVIGVFALSFLFHFMYEWWPNVVTSIFFPVNESIWEHMKIFVSAILVWGLVDKFLLDKVFLIIVIIVTYVSFGLLTYKPPKYFLFYDTNLKKYGI